MAQPQAGKVTLPSRIKPGATLTFSYNPADGPLRDKQDLVALIYLYADGQWTLGDAALQQEGDSWHGTVQLPKRCGALAFLFQSTWSEYTTDRDTNGGQGFVYLVGKPGKRSLQNVTMADVQSGRPLFGDRRPQVSKADSAEWVAIRHEFDALFQQSEDFHDRMVQFLRNHPIGEAHRLQSFQPFVYYNAYRTIAADYFSGQYDQQEFIDMIPDMDFKTMAEVYRSTVSPFHTKKAVRDELNYPIGQALINGMLMKLEDHSYAEGLYMSPGQSDELAVRLMDEHLGNFADILLATERPDQALNYIALISPERLYDTPELNETHIVALKRTGRDAEVAEVMQGAFRANAVTPTMLDMLHAEYIAQGGSEQGYASYVASMKPQEVIAAEKESIRRRLISEPYTPFQLRDMDGRLVSSDDWAGKVVVLDFWASWCYPCKNSFPGMQMAVDHFADDPDVLFYFIDTMETADGYEQKARNYMQQKGFTFQVLFDAKKHPEREGDNSLVFSQMNAINHSMAIPRKMILKDGLVRFTDEGYGGSPSRLADEIIYAVEMLK